MNKPIFATLRRALALLLPAVLVFSMSLAASAVLPKRAVDYQEDFTDAGYADGTLIDNSALPLHEFWVVDQFANYNAAPCSYFETDGDRTVLHIQSYVGVLSASEMFDSYDYSVTMRLPKGHTGGVSVTARHASGSVHGSLYEADYYRENGGSGANDRPGFLHDYSGLAVYPTAKTNSAGNTLFTVGVKCFTDTGKQRTYNQYFDVYLDVNTTEYFTISFEDKDQIITIKVNDSVICTAEMSDPGTFDDPTDGNVYYRHAVLKDADGKVVLDITDAKLAVNARLAIAARSSQCYISHISAYSENDVKIETEDSFVETTAGETSEVTEPAGQPDETIPAETETNMETEVVTEDVTVIETDPISTSEPEATADPVESQPEHTSPAETDLSEKAEAENRNDAILFVLFGVLEILLMVCLIILLLKRKQSGS